LKHPRRFRVSLLTLLISLTGAGAVCGVMGRRMYLADLQTKGAAAMLERYDVTAEVMKRDHPTWLQPAPGTQVGFGGRWEKQGAFSGRDWKRETRVRVSWQDSRETLAVSVMAECAFDGFHVAPITIHDRGAPYNRSYIEELTAEYENRDWEYRIVKEDGNADR